ncbi:hypothetical protein Shyhy01_74210 [Streptomyces hygroscopicus subsp. hygroscopicus]|nr:hypothetical protein Shyhy01_74210 [Streptomyces hygroscopicus subsp. hygroscopicus]
MPGRAIIASVSGLAAGAAATLLVTDEGPGNGISGALLLLGGGLAALTAATTVALTAIRHWLNAHAEHTRQTAQQIAVERSVFIEASGQRARELADREERLHQRAEQASAYVMGIARRLDEALAENGQLERELAEVTARYEELARDHNCLVRETLRERADRFRRRPTTPTAPESYRADNAPDGQPRTDVCRSGGGPPPRDAAPVPPSHTPRLSAHRATATRAPGRGSGQQPGLASPGGDRAPVGQTAGALSRTRAQETGCRSPTPRSGWNPHVRTASARATA